MPTRAAHLLAIAAACVFGGAVNAEDGADAPDRTPTSTIQEERLSRADVVPARGAMSMPVPRETGTRARYEGTAYGLLVGLLVICAFAFLIGRRRRSSTGTGSTAAIKIRERAWLGNRQAIYLVEVGERSFLIGAGSQGAPVLLSEIGPHATDESDPTRNGQ